MVIALHIQFKFTIHIRHRSILSSLLKNTGTDYGFSILVYYKTLNPIIFKILSLNRACKKPCHTDN